MNILQDVITYIRRIIKSPSNADISDALIIDYINRFWINDIDARLQVFDLKKTYQFMTQPGVDRYNMPLYDIQTESGNQQINFYPVYQGFLGPAYINGVPVAFQTQQDKFFSVFPKIVQQMNVVAVGNGGTGYSFNLPILSGFAPIPNNPPLNGIIRGHVDIQGIIATGINEDPPLSTTIDQKIPVTSISSAFFVTAIDGTGQNMVVQDSGQFLVGNYNYGLIMSPGKAPYGNTPLDGGYSTTSNTVNYLTGEVNLHFPFAVPAGNNINASCYFFQSGLPRGILFYDNVITLRMPPAYSYLVELDGYLTPAAFLASSDAVPFGYMSEYIARGAARKILSDTGDNEQFQFYEPLFIEQEQLVWKRSQRIWTSTRTETIYSQGLNYGSQNLAGQGGI